MLQLIYILLRHVRILQHRGDGRIVNIRILTVHRLRRKLHASIDTDSLSVMDWKITTASAYDENMAFGMIDSVRDFRCILMDAAYDSSDIYDYIFENTHAMPVIDTNRRRGIVEYKLSYNRKLGMEHIWYVEHRNYDISIGGIIVAYNCIVMANKITGTSERKIMHIVNLGISGYAKQ